MNKILALFGLLVCVGALLRMMLGARRRQRLDAWARDRWAALRGLARPRPRQQRQDAAREAEALIRRAAQGRSAKPPSKLH